jgi:hypothetical protein
MKYFVGVLPEDCKPHFVNFTAETKIVLQEQNPHL